ncbi:M61 family metallopeptidase [Algoriphagus yeomjeoni]|uniref:Putative metalloprotease with PDZ domain n=1 Tax=Algoriphagus yeomjeoni TaxID=291403 RepID=A0A327NY53_9BACT|nr:M61 family peptidase [Algoriphagus yeomjeoni]RAI83572.1 putative metalloprotease with PDZ domain [Algoriphagus yeomjeoni]
MKFLIKSQNPVSQFIQITLYIPVRHLSQVRLQLPAWRAGRYQLANYVQNIRSLQVISPNGDTIPHSKLTKDLWEFSPDHVGEYQVHYEYYCAKMDAGSCWVDDEQLYLNFVNCCFEVEGHADEKILVEVDHPRNFQSCTTLPSENNEYYASNFQQLADSSFLASQSLTHESVELEGTVFHLWFNGQIHFDLTKFKTDVQGFAEKLIEAFGEFPVEEYHFIYQLLPYSHYHGVEHQRGTVITFGPAESLSERKNLNELMGVSCHELYHAWNVCQIRPVEIMPYDFSKEAYHEAGWMVEGVTTYMGDIFLLRSGYFSLEEYFETFEKVLNRESINFGWQNQSILESSFDLWIDGYVAGIPDKKVSIYTHGALIAFCLDAMLLDENSSLHQVMKILWRKFGKPKIGYTLEEVWEVILSQTEHSIYFNQFYEDFIAGNEDIFPVVEKHLSSLGIELGSKPKEDHLASTFGIIKSEDGKITKIHPDGEAYQKLMVEDVIKSEEIKDGILSISIIRFGRKLEIELTSSASNLFKDFFLIDKKSNQKRTAWIS